MSQLAKVPIGVLQVFGTDIPFGYPWSHPLECSIALSIMYVYSVIYGPFHSIVLSTIHIYSAGYGPSGLLLSVFYGPSGLLLSVFYGPSGLLVWLVYQLFTSIQLAISDYALVQD